jgi:hypothetical protein
LKPTGLSAGEHAMTLDEFRRSVTQAEAPDGVSGPLVALWWAAKEDWERAHAIVMDEDSREAAWVHAYLHRVEGDHENAGYWYRRAAVAAARTSLEDEWRHIATALLNEAR